MAKDNQKINAKRQSIKSLDGSLLKEMVLRGADELRSNIDEVNRLNVFPVPDGDTGDNMFSTVDSGVKAIEGLDTDNLAEVMRVLSHGMLLGARGNSGVILSQFFKGVADGFENSENADPIALGAALEAGVKEAYSTVTTPTEGTILTVAREAVEYAVSKINPKTTIRSFFNDFVKELHASVERTPESLPALKEAGVVDSGGAGLFYLMDGFNRVLRGEKSIQSKKGNYTYSEEEKNTGEKATEIHFDENSDMQFSYCTELLVQLLNKKRDINSFSIENLREFLSSIGDSSVTVKSGSVIKIHVHTFSPDKVLSYMLQYGDFIKVKIENMSLQHSKFESKTQNSKQSFTNTHNNYIIQNENNIDKSSNKSNGTLKKYGIVAISGGDGIDEIFKKLGADKTINIKSGEAPSANDFLNAAKNVNASEVFIFPNNKNFILAAEQAAKMAMDFKIHVIPSKNIASGYVALSMIDLNKKTIEEITRTATEAIDNAITGSVFTAARDTKCAGLKIKVGERVGTIEKDIVVKAKNTVECAVKLGKRLIVGKFVLTVFKGRSATDKDMELIQKKIKKACPEIEIYTINSGQDVFEYIFVAE